MMDQTNSTWISFELSLDKVVWEWTKLLDSANCNITPPRLFPTLKLKVHLQIQSAIWLVLYVLFEPTSY